MELAEKIGKALKIKLNITKSNIVDGSPIKRCPDITTIKNLGYKPKYSFNKAVEKTAYWYWNYFNRGSNEK